MAITRTGGRTQLLRVVLLGLSLVLVVAGFEVFLRAAKIAEPPRRPIESPRPDLYQADEAVGYRLWRSTRTLERYPATAPEPLPLVSNSDGFRMDREFDEPDPRRRALVVGDSMAFGLGVRAEERFSDRMEAMMPGWRVDNLAMTGWGLDLMLRGLEHVGAKADPELVLLAVYTDDLRRLLPYYPGVGFAYPKFALEDGKLRSVPYPRPRWWRRLHLYQLWYRLKWHRLVGRDRYALNAALLDRFDAWARAHEAALVLAFLPGRRETPEDERRRAFLGGWSAEAGRPFLDLTGPIHGAGVDRTYIEGNWHWSPTGHRIAAEAIVRFLRELEAAGELGPRPAG